MTPNPRAVEEHAAIVTKNITFGSFVFRENISKKSVPKSVMLPIRISIIPTIRIFRYFFNRNPLI